MIVAELGSVTVTWGDGQLDLLDAGDYDERRIRAAFDRPAEAIRSRELPDGTIERYFAKVDPGTDEHARAVLLKLRARIVLDTA